MRYWDSSAVVPLLVEELASPGARALYATDPDVIVSWSTPLEVVSGVCRREREGALVPEAVREAIERLDELSGAWHEVLPTDGVRLRARRLLRVHPLRAGDALQLASAIVAAEDRPASLALVTLDDRLAEAAAKEGFSIVRPFSPAAANLDNTPFADTQPVAPGLTADASSGPGRPKRRRPA